MYFNLFLFPGNPKVKTENYVLKSPSEIKFWQICLAFAKEGMFYVLFCLMSIATWKIQIKLHLRLHGNRLVSL